MPRRQPRRCQPELEARILAAREASRYGPARLGAMLGLPASTVAKVLTRHGASRLPRPARPEVMRYERARPGELLHVDTKRLGRFWHGRQARSFTTASSAHRVPAGITCTSLSTTTAASPTAIGRPYRFSIDGKYDAGPVTFASSGHSSLHSSLTT